jgi:uncharacterized protein YjiS (DUF1127 family)
MSVHYPSEWLQARDVGEKKRLPRHHSRPGLLARLSAGIAARLRREAERRELYSLSAEDLHDIGINRGDIPRLFAPSFAQERAARGIGSRR